MYGTLIPASLVLSLGLFGRAAAFDITSNSNLAVYWGQDGAGNQQSLAYYCADDTIDTIPMAFLYQFSGEGDLPVINLANTCSPGSNDFAGSELANCSFLASDIKTCQSKGKIITMSLGGATGQVGFSSDSQAESLADQVWDMFLGGSSDTRPFGDAVLDGVDLDIESGSPAHYPAFVNRIRSHAQGASKRYYVTAAPQCPFPDVYIGEALNEASFDAVYVQFYNNYCGLNAPSEYNFATWDNWAKTQSANKDVKVYIGAPGSSASAGSGYVDESTLANFVKEAQEKYSSFGGVMLWDASTAYTNNRYDKSIKTSMTSSSKTLLENQPNPPVSSSSATAAKTSTKAASSSSAEKTSTKAASTSSAEKTSTKVAPTSSVEKTSAKAAPTSSAAESKTSSHVDVPASSTSTEKISSKVSSSSASAEKTSSKASSSSVAHETSVAASSASVVHSSVSSKAPEVSSTHAASSSAKAEPTTHASSSSASEKKTSSPSVVVPTSSAVHSASATSQVLKAAPSSASSSSSSSSPLSSAASVRSSSAPAATSTPKTCKSRNSTKRATTMADDAALADVAFTMPRRHSRHFKRHSSRK